MPPARNAGPASPRTQRKRPGDVTGTNSQKLVEQRDKDKLDEEKAAFDAAAAEKAAIRNSVVDYSTHDGSVADTVNEVEVEDHEDDEAVSLPDLKDTYSKDEVEALLAALRAKPTTTHKVKVGSVEVDQDVDVQVVAKKEAIRVNFPIEDMTYGREVIDPGDFDELTGVFTRAPRLGNLRILNFEEGRKYIVDKDVADHLRSLGYINEF